MCSRISNVSIYLQVISASVSSLLPNSLLFFQLAVPSFTGSLYFSQSRLEQWCLSF